MGPQRYLQSLFFLSACASLQTALGRVTDVGNVGIIGGQAVQIRDAPYMAGLYGPSGRFMCAGSIVHKSFILTSLACARLPLKEVQVGSNKKNVDVKWRTYISYTQCYKLDKPYYPLEEKDICLLKLTKPLDFKKFHHQFYKVQLPNENEPIKKGTMVDITGWGSKDVYGNYPDTLLRTGIEVKKKCPKLAPGIDKHSLFCAGTPTNVRPIRDIGKGDEGAPVTIGAKQVGIASNTLTKGKRSRYYIKVSSYTKWIKGIIGGY